MWTPVDVCGHGLEIYGSEGWGLSQATVASSPGRATELPRKCGGILFVSRVAQPRLVRGWSASGHREPGCGCHRGPRPEPPYLMGLWPRSMSDQGGPGLLWGASQRRQSSRLVAELVTSIHLLGQSQHCVGPPKSRLIASPKMRRPQLCFELTPEPMLNSSTY